MRKIISGFPVYCQQIILSLSFLLCSSSALAGNSNTLKIALLPIIDTLPFHAAVAKDYFKSEKVEVKAIPVTSAIERDQLMQAGQIDGMINEMISTAFFNRDEIRLQIVGDARSPGPDSPLFRILAAPDSGLISPNDLAGVAIGVSKNTIIEYVTDRLLVKSGLRRNEIVIKSVPVIPERYALLLQGQVKAATIPDPLAMSAVEAGAVQIVNDSAFPRYSVSVLSFSADAIGRKSTAISGFMRAWDRAVGEINSDPESFRALMLEKIRFPENIRDSFKIPPFPRKHVPDRSQWTDMMDWMIEKGLLDAAVSYEMSVTYKFLP